jgi:energy-coupling factor transporter ATP-binding protein EcfA2
MRLKNFKLFQDVTIELGDRVVLIGPNNSGKTTALQALALWDIGVRRWLEKRGAGAVPRKRPGVTINRRDLITIPVPSANLLWRDLHVRSVQRTNGKQHTENVFIEIEVEGITEGRQWVCGLEFYYANEESFYCRPVQGTEGGLSQVPDIVNHVRVAYLPPMSGLSASETRLDSGAMNVRLGEGRTAEVLRNLCYQVLQTDDGTKRWKEIVDRINNLFGVNLNEPLYVAERGEITMSYRDRNGTELDVSSSGRGMQQTLLLLAHMSANQGSVLLLDEPDAHLEVLRQRQIYEELHRTASDTQSQIIAASHSEAILNEAANRDVVIAFVGIPHRIDDRGSQVRKALSEIGFDQYYQAEATGWVLYLEGSTDLAVIRAFADRLNHPVKKHLDRVFVHYVANQPSQAENHFRALREAKPDLIGIAVYDRLERLLQQTEELQHLMWRAREIENYMCTKKTLLSFVEYLATDREGTLFGSAWNTLMEQTIDEIETALRALNKPDPWGDEIKATDDFLDPLFTKFYGSLGIENLTRKSSYYQLALFVAADDIDIDIQHKLDAIHSVAERANPVGQHV